MRYQTAIIQTTIDNVKRYSAPESGPYFLAIFGDTDKMNQRWWMLTHSDNVVLSTFTGLSTVGNLYDTQNINWRTKKKNKRKGDWDPSKWARKNFFFWCTRDKKVGPGVWAILTSRPVRTTCPSYQFKVKQKPSGDSISNAAKGSLSLTVNNKLGRKNNIIIKYIWPLNKSLWWTSLPDRDKRAIQESKRGS